MVKMRFPAFVSVFTLTIMLTARGMGQKPTVNQPAVFTSVGSFIRNEPDYAITAVSAGNRIKTAFLFHSGKISFKDSRGKVVLQRHTLFGYRDELGYMYRFSADQIFRIEDTSGIYIYSRWQPGCTKTFQDGKMMYYFSLEADGEIKRLNPENVLTTFSADDPRRDALLKKFSKKLS